MSSNQGDRFKGRIARLVGFLGEMGEAGQSGEAGVGRGMPGMGQSAQASRRPSAQDVLIQLVLAQATELARAGQYAPAKIMVREVLNAQELPAALDLYARICAQQAHYEEARWYWERALRYDQTNHAYLAALTRLAKIEMQQVTQAPERPERGKK